MFELAIQTIRANLGRLVATVTAIVVGVAFLSAGLMFTDAIKSSLGGTLEEQYAAVEGQVKASEDRAGPPAKIPAALVGAVAAVPGVKSAVGELQGNINIFHSGRTKPDSVTGRRWVDSGGIKPLTVVDGAAPVEPGQMTLDRDSASDFDLKVGDSVRIATGLGERQVTLVGLTAFGPESAQDGSGTASFVDADAFSFLLAGTEEFDRILITVDEDSDAATVLDAVRAVLPQGVVATDRAQFIKDAQGGAAQFATFLQPVLQGFGFLALFVCGFVIANTFAVIVAQRTRELALLRAIGATPSQVRRSLRLEALAIGFVSSLVGLAVGYGLALLTVAILRSFDIKLLGAGARLSLFTVVWCVFWGTFITVASVFLASRRAAKVAPVEAMRASALERIPKKRSFIWLIVLALGGVLLLVGGFAGNAYLIVPGALLFIFGILFSAPIVLNSLARGLRGLFRRSGLAMRLAGDNIERSPRRAASTANALIIGVLLITLVTTAGGSLRTALVNTVNDLSSSDISVLSDLSGIQPALVDQISAVQGVGQVAQVRSTNATVDGIDGQVTSGDVSALKETVDLTASQGSLDDLGPGTMAIVDFGGGGPNGQAPPALGDQVDITTPSGTEANVRVVAVVAFSFDTIFLSNLVDPATFSEIAGDRPATQLFLKVDGRSVKDVVNDIKTLTDSYSSVQVQQGNFIGEILDSVLGWVIAGVNGLLGMSVLIAFIGIVNTMTLSIVERRRELGLLRAVGMMPASVRSMIRGESLIIAMFGTLIGLSAGAFLGFCLTRSLSIADDGSQIGFSFEWGRLAIVAGVGVLVGLLAAAVPARRASRMDVLDALAE